MRFAWIPRATSNREFLHFLFLDGLKVRESKVLQGSDESFAAPPFAERVVPDAVYYAVEFDERVENVNR
jgi:hypothetical protein